MSKPRSVEKAEFDAFLKAYPSDVLHKDITGICEPSMVSYNDFSRGNWPQSIVASVQLFSEFGETDRYFVHV